jgi:hypothetical protein
VSLAPLATQTDVATWGYTLPVGQADALLARASVRLRRAARESISVSTVTVQVDVDRGFVELPAPPVVAVTDVQAVGDLGILTPLIEGTDWWWDGERVVLTCQQPRVFRVQATYSRGRTVIPEGVVELCCQVAVRMSLTPAGMDIGIRERKIDDYSETYAVEMIDAAGNLLPGELSALHDALGTRNVWLT